MATNVRQFLEHAFLSYTGNKAQLRGRFRSPRNEQHHGAAFELFLHEMAARTGYSPLADAPVRGRNIDLRLNLQDGSHAWLEARMLQASENTHFARVRDIIDENIVEGVQLEIQMINEIDRPISERKFREELKSFIAGLPVDNAVDGSTLAHPFIYADGAAPLVKVIARRNRRYGNSAISHVPDAEMPSAGDIHAGLEDKAKKYRGLSGPYIIALCSSKMFVSDHLFEQALFSERPGMPGLWGHARNAHVSAVLACYRFKPSAISNAELRLFHNPQATHPIAEDMFGCEQIRSVNGDLQRTRAVSFVDIMGLPTDWLSAA